MDIITLTTVVTPLRSPEVGRITTGTGWEDGARNGCHCHRRWPHDLKGSGIIRIPPVADFRMQQSWTRN
jgi:hypothetical protein